MKTKALIDNMTSLLNDVAHLAGENLPEEKDGVNNQEFVRLMGALQNAEVAVRGITVTRQEAIERRQQYLNMPEAFERLDRSDGGVSLFAIEISEFEDGENETALLTHEVLVASTSAHKACHEAEMYCVNVLWRAEGDLNVMAINEISDSEAERLRRQIWKG